MLAGRAVELLAQMCANREVDAERMRANLDAGGGFVLSEAFLLALAPRIGRDAAHRLMYDLSIAARASGRTLIDAVRADAVIAGTLDAGELNALLDVASHTGHCAAMVDRVLSNAS